MGANQSREPTTGCPAPPTTVNLSKKPRDDARTTAQLGHDVELEVRKKMRCRCAIVPAQDF